MPTSKLFVDGKLSIHSGACKLYGLKEGTPYELCIDREKKSIGMKILKGAKPGARLVKLNRFGRYEVLVLSAAREIGLLPREKGILSFVMQRDGVLVIVQDPDMQEEEESEW